MSRYIVSFKVHTDGEEPNCLPRVETRMRVFEGDATLEQVHRWISGQLMYPHATDVTLNLDDEDWPDLSQREYAASVRSQVAV